MVMSTDDANAVTGASVISVTVRSPSRGKRAVTMATTSVAAAIADGGNGSIGDGRDTAVKAVQRILTPEGAHGLRASIALSGWRFQTRVV